jgi:hypothetical protein
LHLGAPRAGFCTWGFWLRVYFDFGFTLPLVVS